MHRQEFLSKFGIGLAAVCAGCALSSCGSVPKDDPQPINPSGPNPNPVTFNTDLSSELLNAGEFKVVSGVILVRVATGNVPSSFSAVQVACTHQGTSINYNLAQRKYICPNHGSQFSNSGALLLGPATLPLKQYNVIITGNQLTVIG